MGIRLEAIDYGLVVYSLAGAQLMHVVRVH